MDGAVIRRRVVVSGLVQGVWFRDTCQRAADQHGVGGWVRNRPDLTVEAAFEGLAEAVEAMVQWCREGPPRARVSGVEVTVEEPIGEDAFRVFW